ncbi:MAG TPA: hypothetical protein VJJ23_00700 [Candidatus Nanoarchaeia archaeon]|nr:hypothetical protein [Candidatus Nanoarchaeia archaeon]
MNYNLKENFIKGVSAVTAAAYLTLLAGQAFADAPGPRKGKDALSQYGDRTVNINYDPNKAIDFARPDTLIFYDGKGHVVKICGDEKSDRAYNKGTSTANRNNALWQCAVDYTKIPGKSSQDKKKSAPHKKVYKVKDAKEVERNLDGVLKQWQRSISRQLDDNWTRDYNQSNELKQHYDAINDLRDSHSRLEGTLMRKDAAQDSSITSLGLKMSSLGLELKNIEELLANPDSTYKPIVDGEKKEDHSTRNWLIGGAIAIVVGGIVYWISLDDNGKIGETGTYIDDPHTGVGGR